MKLSSLLIIASTALTSQVFEEESIRGKGYFKLDTVLQEFEKSVDYGTDFSKRNVATLPLSINRNIYTTNISIGSRKMVNEVMLDSGSSQAWVKGSEGLNCQRHEVGSASHQRCLGFGYFDAKSSKSFRDHKKSFSISYKDGTYANGTWAHDTIKLTESRFSIPNFDFALVDKTNSDYGVIGIGLVNNDGYKGDNLPSKLKELGIIDRNMYAIGLKPTGASVIFGGLDRNLVLDEINLFPILKSAEEFKKNKKPTKIDITLNSVSILSMSMADYEDLYEDDHLEKGDAAIEIINQNMYCLLDTGSTFSYLPEDAVKQISEVLGLQETDDGNFEMDCADFDESNRKDDYWIEFDFQGWKKQVRIDYFKERIGDKCYLGISASHDGTATLGDNFLRHVYMTVDLESYQVGLANLNPYHTGSENDIKIEKLSPNSTYGVPIPGYYNLSYSDTNSSDARNSSNLKNFLGVKLGLSTTGDISYDSSGHPGHSETVIYKSSSETFSHPSLTFTLIIGLLLFVCHF